MKNFVQNSIEETIRQARRKKTWKRVITLFAVVTIFCTAVSLKFEANTLERIPMCGLTEHTHEGGCMDEAGNFVCGLDEHIHTDACFQEAPVKPDAPVEEVNMDINDSFEETVDSEDIEPPAEEIAFELGAADEEEPVVPVEEAFADAEPKEAELPVYDFQGADHASLSAVLAQAGIECTPSEVTDLGESILEDDQALSIRVEPMENDYQIIPLRDFIDDDTVPFAVFTADNIWLITLKNGVTPVEIEYVEDKEPTEVSDEEEKPTEVENDEFSESEAEDEIDAGEAVEDTPHQNVEEVIGDMTEQSEEETTKDEVEVPAEETEDSESDEVKEASDEDGIEGTHEDADEQSEEAADENAAEQSIEETGEDTAEENEEAADEETTEQREDAGDEGAAPRLTWTGEAFAVALNWDGELSEGAELLVQALDVDSEDYAAYRQAIELTLNPVVPEEEVVSEDVKVPAEEVEVVRGDLVEETYDEEAEPIEPEQLQEEATDVISEPAAAIEDIYLFTVAVAQGDEIVVPEGGEVIVTAENALFFRGAEPSGDGCFADYRGEVLAVVMHANVVTVETDADEAEQPAEEPSEEKMNHLEYRGEGFTVTMTYADDAEIPEDAALDVREILPGTEEYAIYSDQTDAALSENWDEATALPRFFDINIFYNDEEIQPAAPV